MSQSANWKYCVVGNITKSHTDGNGIVRYGTSAFTGGTKVYLCGKYWDPSTKTIVAIGITRGSRKYHVFEQRTFSMQAGSVSITWYFRLPLVIPIAAMVFPEGSQYFPQR